MSRRKLWTVYTVFFVASAVAIGLGASQAFKPKTTHHTARVDTGAVDARLVAQAWAGAVETGDTGLACEFADRAVTKCAEQMGQLASFVAGQGVFKIGPATRRGQVWAVKAALVMADGRTQQLTVFVRGNRFLGIAA